MNNKRPSSQTWETYKHVQNFKQDLYCVIPSNRITTGMRCISWNSPKTNKNTRQRKEKKQNKSSYISNGCSVESKSKSHNISMVRLGPNLHSHNVLFAIWHSDINNDKCPLQFIKHMKSFSLATIRSHSHWEQDTFQTKVFSVTVHFKKNSPLEISSLFEFVLCPPLSVILPSRIYQSCH